MVQNIMYPLYSSSLVVVIGIETVIAAVIAVQYFYVIH